MKIAGLRSQRTVVLIALFAIAIVVGVLALVNDSESPTLAAADGVSPASRALASIASAATPNVVQVHVLAPSMHQGSPAAPLAANAGSAADGLQRIATQLSQSSELASTSRVLGSVLQRYVTFAQIERDAFTAGTAMPADFPSRLSAAFTDWRAAMQQIQTAAKTDLLKTVPSLPFVASTRG
jgi:hypothetical protein